MNLRDLKAELGGFQFFRELFHPAHRKWFIACSESVRAGMSLDEARSLTEAILAEASDSDVTPFQRRILEAHWPCLRRPQNQPIAVELPQAELEDRARSSGFGTGLIRDLFHEFHDTASAGRPGWRFAEGLRVGAVRPNVKELRVPILLVSKEARGDPETERGIIANLTLELVPNGGGELYPSTALLFVERAEDWCRAENAAGQALSESSLWPGEFNIRWHLALQSSKPLPFRLEGESAGAAFLAALTELLWADREKRALPAQLSSLPHYTAVTAALDSAGQTLLPVEKMLDKLYAAALRSYPPIRAIVVAREQDLNFLDLAEHPISEKVWHDPEKGRRAPLVVKADNLAQAATLLQQARQLDDHGFPVKLPDEVPHLIPRTSFADHIEKFIAETSSGYLVIRGHMGRGKTTALAWWIRRLQAARQAPIYHFLGRHGSLEAQPHRIAAAFYYQLLAKHSMKEPDAWTKDESRKARPIEKKLELLLNRLSEDTSLLPRGTKEVLYLEAADQADLPPGHSLVPRFMCELPEHILCVITTRPELNWLDLLRGVQAEDFDRLIDDWRDIRDHLNRRGGCLQPPLPLELINRIATPSGQPDEKPPWFFTVDARLEQLEGKRSSDHSDETLRSDPAPWRTPPEDLVKEERRRVFRLAALDPHPTDEDECWRIFGLLAVAGEELSPSQLRALGLWNRKTKKVLDLALNFFEPRCFEPKEDERYVFLKTGYQREVLEHFDAEGLRQLHRILALRLSEVWTDHQSSVRMLALRSLPAHLRLCGLWDSLCKLLLTFTFLETKIGASLVTRDPWQFDVSDLLLDFHNTIEGDPAIPPGNPLLDQVSSLFRAIDRSSILIREDATLLLQETYNQLWPFWDEGTKLGQSLRQGAREYGRDWLKLENKPRSLSQVTPLRAILSHPGGVSTVGISPDGKTLASAGYGSTVRLWEVQTGRNLGELCVKSTFSEGHQIPESRVRFVAFSPDGISLVCIGMETLTLWNYLTGKLLCTITDEPDEKRYACCVFLSDCRTLLCGGDKVDEWSIHTRRLGRNLDGNHGEIRTVALSFDEKLLAAGSADDEVMIWNLNNGELLWKRTANAPVNAVAFWPEGDRLISGDSAGSLIEWSVSSGEGTWFDQKAHFGKVSSILFGPHEEFMATAGPDTIRLWNTKTRKVHARLTGHLSTDAINALAFSGSCRKLASGADDGTVRIWNVNVRSDPSEKWGHAAAVCAIAFSDDGSRLASAGIDHKVLVWDGEANELEWAFERLFDVPRSVAFVPGGKVLAVGICDGVGLWDLESGKLSSELLGQTKTGNGWGCSQATKIAVSKDGNAIAAGFLSGQICVWDLRTGQLRFRQSGHGLEVLGLAFSSDRKALGSCGDGSVCVWDAISGEVRFALERPDLKADYVTRVVFSPDNKTLVCCGSNMGEGRSNGVLHLRNAISGDPIKTLASNGWITSVVFSSDSNTLATGDWNGNLKLWSLSAGTLLSQTRCVDTIFALRFAEELKSLQVADAGGSVHWPNVFKFEIAPQDPSQASRRVRNGPPMTDTPVK